MEFDHRRADLVRGIYLGAIGGNENGNAAARISQGRNESGKAVFIALHVKPALGRQLLTALRHDADSMRAVPERNRLHLLCGRHFEIERHFEHLHKALDIAIRNMPAILSQMGGDAVRAGFLREFRGAHGIGVA